MYAILCLTKFISKPEGRWHCPPFSYKSFDHTDWREIRRNQRVHRTRTNDHGVHGCCLRRCGITLLSITQNPQFLLCSCYGYCQSLHLYMLRFPYQWPNLVSRLTPPLCVLSLPWLYIPMFKRKHKPNWTSALAPRGCRLLKTTHLYLTSKRSYWNVCDGMLLFLWGSRIASSWMMSTTGTESHKERRWFRRVYPYSHITVHLEANDGYTVTERLVSLF